MLLAEVSGAVTIAVAVIAGLTGTLSGLGAAYLSNKSTERQHNRDLREKSTAWLRDERVKAYAAIAPAINEAIILAEQLGDEKLNTPESWTPPYQTAQQELLEARRELRTCFSLVTLVEPSRFRAASRALRENALSYVDHLAGLPTTSPTITLEELKTQATALGDDLADDIQALGAF